MQKHVVLVQSKTKPDKPEDFFSYDMCIATTDKKYKVWNLTHYAINVRS